MPQATTAQEDGDGDGDGAEAAGVANGEVVPAGATAVRAEVPGSVWQLMVKPGDRVRAGDRVVVLETMKMETPVAAPSDGTVLAVHCAQGAEVVPGQLLITLAAA